MRIINLPEVKQRIIEIGQAEGPFAITNVTRTDVQRRFFSLKTQMLAEFLNHPVTQEIMAGPTAKNISGTLATLSGADYGNLFSFIGFESDTDPIAPIVKLLQSTDIEYRKTTPKVIEFVIKMPTAQDIFDITPMPWATGRSWAQGIEQGISGLGAYIYKPKGVKSRSGTAIQTNFGKRSKSRPGLVAFRKTQYGRFNNQPYISSFINEWEKNFRQIK